VGEGKGEKGRDGKAGKPGGEKAYFGLLLRGADSDADAVRFIWCVCLIREQILPGSGRIGNSQIRYNTA